MRDPLKPWKPTEDEPFDLRRAGHLFRRAGIGASLRLRERSVRQGVGAALRRVLERGDGEDVDAAFPHVFASEEFDKLRAYRVWRLMSGRHRMRERMSLFWHDHFATSQRKVRDVRQMARQLHTFDELGTGRFDDLLLAVCRDPAMLRWLDNDVSSAGKPNENFARELFELFSLGRGNYTERDIREAARAFTGWRVRDGVFHFASRDHDRGTKEVFGQRGRFGGEDIVEIVVERVESARFLARKLLVLFVHPEPSEGEIDAVAGVYRENDRHIGKTVEVILRSRLFFSERAWRSKIKSPIDYSVGTVRSLGASASPQRVARAAAAMGQSIGEPPNVAGWPGERAWLNSATWLLRANFAAELEHRYRLDPGFDELDLGVDEAVDALLDGEIGPSSRAALERFRGAGKRSSAAIFHAVQTLPEAQLA